jgi:hypothetical protein
MCNYCSGEFDNREFVTIYRVPDDVFEQRIEISQKIVLNSDTPYKMNYPCYLQTVICDGTINKYYTNVRPIAYCPYCGEDLRKRKENK